MVERVARAMVAEDSGQEGSMLFDTHWKEFGEGYMKTARAAIEAMREPTEEMVNSGECADDGMTHTDTVVDIYQAMIDAALSE